MLRRFGRSRGRAMSPAHDALRITLPRALSCLVVLVVLVIVVGVAASRLVSGGSGAPHIEEALIATTASTIVQPPVTKLVVRPLPAMPTPSPPQPSPSKAPVEGDGDSLFCSDALEAKRKRAIVARGAALGDGGRAALLRDVSFPHNHNAPAAIKTSLHDALLMSFSLAGAKSVADGNLLAGAAAAHGGASGDFGELGSGWHCFAARDTNERCLVAAAEFVVQERSRKGTEYAVPAVSVVDLLTVRERYLEEVADNRRLHIDDDTSRHDNAVEPVNAQPSSGKRGGSADPVLSVVCPRAVPVGVPALCTARWNSAPPGNEQANLVGATVDTVLRNALRSTLRLHLRVESAACDANDPRAANNRPVDVDLFGGVGSFWISEQQQKSKESRRSGGGAAVDDAPPFYALGGGHRVLLRRDNCDAARSAEAAPPETFSWNVTSEFDAPREAQHIRLPRPVQLDPRGGADFLLVHTEADLVEATKKSEKSSSSNNRPLCRVHFTQSLTITRSFDFGVASGQDGEPHGCVLAFGPGVIVTVGADVKCTIRGAAHDPVLLTAAAPQKLWGGIVLAPGASLSVEHAVVMLTGGSTQRVKGTGTHVKLTPAFTASDDSTLAVADTTIANCKGSGFGLGKHATADIRRTLLQDVAQGGECVSCSASLRDVHILDVPYRPAKTKPEIYQSQSEFVDEDNDGFYFRGGTAVVERVMIANTLDDGIDSASSKGDAEHSTLTVKDSVIWNVQHEGIALSGSKGVKRTVAIQTSVFAFCQQGIENGYSPASHHASVDGSLLMLNTIGVRHGDNYNLDVHGSLKIARSTFVFNKVAHILNFVKKEHGHVRVVSSADDDAHAVTAANRVTTSGVTFRSLRSADDAAHKVDTTSGAHTSALFHDAIDSSQTSSAEVSNFHKGTVCARSHFSTADDAPNIDADEVLRNGNLGDGATGNDAPPLSSWWAGHEFPEAMPVTWQWLLAASRARHGL